MIGGRVGSGGVMNDVHETKGGGQVLVIACAFPPTGGPGVQRTVKFVKYLPLFGWTPIVWASEVLPGLPEDRTLLSDVPPGVCVHRIGQDRAARLMNRVGQIVGGHLFPGAGWVSGRLDGVRAHRAAQMLPDDQIGWARRTLGSIERSMATFSPEVIYSTYSPASNHWIALQLKRSTGLPWVADFRDLWTDDYRYQERSARRRVAHRTLEQEVLESADVVVGVTRRQTEILAGHVPQRRDRFVTITNGYDPADFAGVRPKSSGVADGALPSCSGSAPFAISHVGRLCRRRTPDALFEGLAKFVGACGDSAGSVVFNVVGHAGRAVVERLRSIGLVVHTHGQVHHGDAVAHMRGSHLLLLPIPEGPNSDSVIPGKLFEYLAAGRAILLIGSEKGEAARIVSGCGAGRAVPFDAEAIAASLLKSFLAWRAGQLESGCPLERCEPFSRVHLTRHLADVFGGLTAPRQQTRDVVRSVSAREISVRELEFVGAGRTSVIASCRSAEDPA